MTFSSYFTGTVTIAAGGTTIAGTGANWTYPNASPGDIISVGGQIAVVQDVTNATTLVIDAWPFAAVTNASYVLYKISPLRFVGGQAMADVSALVAALNTDGWYVFVPSSANGPDPSYGNDGQFAFQAATGKLWAKEGGVWTFLGVYRGFNPRGVYDPTATYAVGDLTSFGGGAFVWINPTPGNTQPPDPSNWMVMGQKGDQGDTGPVPLLPVMPWATGTSYVIGPPASFVQQGGSSYQCLVAHTSGTFANDLAAGYWGLVAQNGIGDLLSTNNLSELTDKNTALMTLMGVSFGASQSSLTALQMLTARTNIGALGDVKITVWNMTNSYTPAANLKFAICDTVGGGGGAGGALADATHNFGGSGGGSGGHDRSFFTGDQIRAAASAAGGSIPVTIGTAGAAGGWGATANGTNGGTTSIGSLISSNGGVGGFGAAVTQSFGGSDGAPKTTGPMAGNLINDGGSAGEMLSWFMTSGVGYIIARGGNGGSSVYGGGGKGSMVYASYANGNPATGAGSGGGGASSNNVAAGAVGGNGMAGRAWVIEIY